MNEAGEGFNPLTYQNLELTLHEAALHYARNATTDFYPITPEGELLCAAHAYGNYVRELTND